MTELQIVPVDPFDEDAVRAWNRAYELADLHDRGPDADVWTFEEAMLELQQQTDTIRRLAWRGVVDGDTVASAWLALPLKDNAHRAIWAIHVRPDARRRGYGDALLAQIEAAARDARRTTLASNAYWPYELGLEGAGSPGVAFARKHGYSLALGDVRRMLRLPVATRTLDELAAEAASRHEGYTLHTFVGPIPDEYVADWAALDAVIETDAPTGDLDIEPASADVAEVREAEALIASQGRTIFNAIAVTATGETVAYTQMVVPKHDAIAFQWGTLVRKDHRGHRLGAAVKIANVRLLQTERPDVRTISTYNAESNVHMIAVNEALGFVPTERLGEFQKKL